MRPVCESCAKPQPHDWQPGHLCIHCGLAVRQETRCFWCAKWTPLAKYCRKCGADVLEDATLFGPARMLKDAGTDRFTIPRLLREFDADRIETFRAIYQSQASIVATHVADLEYVQTFLHCNVWSAELEDQLISQLPWPDGAALPLLRYGDSERLQQIAKLTPIPSTAALASIALYGQGDWMQQPRLLQSLNDEDSRIAEEAALALTHWRAIVEPGVPRNAHSRIEMLLSSSALTEQASVRLPALFPQKYPQDATAMASSDPDIRFAAALNLGDSETLRAAARDTTAHRYAALLRLAGSDQFDPNAAALLHTLPYPQIVDVIDCLLRKKQPYPLLTDALLTLFTTNHDGHVRNRVATLLCRDCTHETAIAILRADPQTMDTIQILLRSNVPPETFTAIGEHLIDHDLFSASMYGMDNAAKAGCMPEAFVPANYARASEKQRPELIRFAERQLEARECEPLKDFLIRRCFEDRATAQRAAWSSMSRLVTRESHGATCPFRLNIVDVERIFRSMDEFLRLCTAFLRTAEWRDDVIIFDPASRFLRYHDDDVWKVTCESGYVGDFMATLVELIEAPNLRGSVQSDAFYPLIGIGAACPKLRPAIEENLHRLKNSTQFEMAADYAIRRIEQLTGHPANTQSDPQDLASTSSAQAPRASTISSMLGSPRYSNEEE